METRRHFLTRSIPTALSLGVISLNARSQALPRTRLILLGTKGGPRVGNTGRSNPSQAIVINGSAYVVDCGYGVSRQLVAAKVPLKTVRNVLLTHLHSDHDLEYGPLLYNAWASDQPVRIDAWGPKGMKKMTADFFSSIKFDLDTRIADEGRSDLRRLVSVHEIGQPGEVMRNADVRITCCLVKHPPIERSYAYRFHTANRSIVISGDTTYSPQLAEFAKGADVLVHEAMYLPAIEALLKGAPDAPRLRSHLIASHTVTDDVGKVAAAAGVKTLVLSHLVPGDNPTITDEMWSEGVKKHFSGQVIVGRDLMEI